MTGLVATSGLPPAQARQSNIEPTELARGSDPSRAYLVRDTIRDGARSIPATSLGDHSRLWTVARGYLLEDSLRGGAFRLVLVSAAGRKTELGRSPGWPSTAVSPDGTRVAWAQGRNDLGSPTLVKVADLRTGRMVAVRRFPWASPLGVSGGRVLLTRRGADIPVATLWWNYHRNTLVKLSRQPGLRADLGHDRLVLATGPQDSFCNRVAPLSKPARTLWRSCRLAPHAWSPNGRRVAVTHTYLDDAGTDFWQVVTDRTVRPLGRVAGRLDWDAVWEDNDHFLTLALGGSGNAAIIRCTVAGRCERASRLWFMGKATYQPNYIAPPVVLSSS